MTSIAYLCFLLFGAITITRTAAQINRPPLIAFPPSSFDRDRESFVTLQMENPPKAVPARLKVNDFIVFHRLAERKCIEYSGDDFIYENRSSTKAPFETKRILSCPSRRVFVISVVGGKAAAPKQYPHMALVGYGSDAETVEWLCGGSIISLRFVLTAAHCIITRRGDPTFVRVGDLDYGKVDDDAAPQTIAVKRTVYPENYQRGYVYNDIGLLELVQNIQITVYARPACLNTDPDIIATEEMIATGWGHTELFGNNSPILMEVELEQFSTAECSNTYKPAKTLPSGIIGESQMCAGSRTEVKDTCNGDSGGPLQVYHKEIKCMFKIVGVTSFGQGCGIAGVPGVYTRVSNYLDWIESIAFASG